jgi:hypothetical protein
LKDRYRERQKCQEDDREEVSSYWMILRKRVDTANLKRKHYIALCGEFTLEEAMELSQSDHRIN